MSKSSSGNKPDISVVIPVYNVAQYLRECLDSVLSQTFRNIEVICVDDCSTDSSPDILAEYAALDGRIRVFNLTSNLKPGVVRNRGLVEARGEYIHFIDSDDMLSDTNAFMELFTLAKEQNLDQIIFKAGNVMEDFPIPPECAQSVQRMLNAYKLSDRLCGTVMPGPELLGKLMGAKEYSPCIWLRFMRTETIRKEGLHFPVDSIHEDSLFTPQMFLVSQRCYAVNRQFYTRRIRPGSIMTAPGCEEEHYRANLANIHEWMKFIRRFNGCSARPNTIDDVTAIFFRNLGSSFRRLPEETAASVLREFDYANAFDVAVMAFITVRKDSLAKRERIKKLKCTMRKGRDKARKERNKARMGKKRAIKQRNARPNSIRECIAFIMRRILTMCGIRNG